MKHEFLKAGCRIVVLNYNGRDLLERCLPSVAAACARSRFPCAVTVLDNGSDDGSEQLVSERFGGVQFSRSPKNLVYCSYNAFAATAVEKYLLFLNNDIEVEEGFVDPLLLALENDPEACFAAPRVVHPATGAVEGCRSRLEMRYGLPWGTATFAGHEAGADRPGLTMQSGFGAFRRSFFLELGGFDDLYLPGTVEDMDLCFRAYRRGWRGLYCPESIAYHMGQVSFKRVYGLSGIRRMNRRNLYLFVWKNVRGLSAWVAHLTWLPLHLVKSVFAWQWEFVFAFTDALRRLPQALARRRLMRKEPSLRKDEEIFRLSRSL